MLYLHQLMQNQIFVTLNMKNLYYFSKNLYIYELLPLFQRILHIKCNFISKFLLF